MEVIATKAGYHGKLRAEGDKFTVPDGSKASWFVPVEKATHAPPASGKADAEAKAKAKADAEAKAKPEQKPGADLV